MKKLYLNNMIPQTIKTGLLEIAQLTWHLYNKIIFFCICAYYQLLSNIEQANKVSCDHIISLDASKSDLRIPKHIAMVFTNEIDYLDLNSIARLLCWCKQLQIEAITLYDDSGRLRSREEELIKFVGSQMKLLGCEKPIHRIEGLSIISRQDGRQKFVEKISTLLKNNPEKIDVDTLQNQVGWPIDPELLINFGSPLCLRGFPPWQLR